LPSNQKKHPFLGAFQDSNDILVISVLDREFRNEERNMWNSPNTSSSCITFHHQVIRRGAKKELTDRSSSTLPFPFKLHQLLEEAEEYSISHIISWLPSDDAFKIHDPDAFVTSVMTKYFKQSKIKSFTRQLYIYGFSKISQGPNMGGFFNPQFRRADQNACMLIPRRITSEDRRVKSNRPKIINCRKLSHTIAKAGEPIRSCSSETTGMYRRPAAIPQMLFGDLPTIETAPFERFTEASINKKGALCSERRALSLFDQTFGDDNDFDCPINQGSLPSLGHISSLQSRALPGPPGGLRRLDVPSLSCQPSLGNLREASSTIYNPKIASSNSQSSPRFILEPRAIEDMCYNMPDDELASLNRLVLLGSEVPMEGKHFHSVFS